MSTLNTKFWLKTVLLCLVTHTNLAFANSDLERCRTLISQQSFDEAYAVCTTAAEQGSGNAQLILGNMYDRGFGITQDYAEAVKWYRAAAEQGSASAQWLLGWMYRNGEGVIQDYLLAHMWFNISAANGNVSAAEARNRVSALMSNDQIIQAQALARQCVNSNYTDC